MVYAIAVNPRKQCFRDEHEPLKLNPGIFLEVDIIAEELHISLDISLMKHSQIEQSLQHVASIFFQISNELKKANASNELISEVLMTLQSKLQPYLEELEIPFISIKT